MKTELKIPVRDRTAGAYLASPEKGGPGVLVLHAWWGLKPFFKQVCDQLSEHGFTALAPDLYQGRIAKTIDEAEALMGECDSELMGDTVKAAKDHLVSLRPGKPIGTLGFSMGAQWASVVASSEPDVSATVLFYGIGGVDFSQVSSKILGHFAEVDEWEPLDGVRQMEAEIKAAGLDATIHLYPKVGHWFVEQDRPEYEPESAQLAWQRTYDFMKKNIS
jgi:carboxymethylenebutenolidase